MLIVCAGDQEWLDLSIERVRLLGNSGGSGAASRGPSAALAGGATPQNAQVMSGGGDNGDDGGDDDGDDELQMGEELSLSQVLQAKQAAAERAGLVLDLA